MSSLINAICALITGIILLVFGLYLLIYRDVVSGKDIIIILLTGFAYLGYMLGIKINKEL